MFPPLIKKYSTIEKKENKRSDFTQSSVRDWD